MQYHEVVDHAVFYVIDSQVRYNNASNMVTTETECSECWLDLNLQQNQAILSHDKSYSTSVDILGGNHHIIVGISSIMTMDTTTHWCDW